MDRLLAHAAPISYRCPLPIWISAVAGAAAVPASAPAAAVRGHVVAVFAAHRAAPERTPRVCRALAPRVPLVLLMVGYTMAGLWVLVQQMTAGG